MKSPFQKKAGPINLEDLQDPRRNEGPRVVTAGGRSIMASGPGGAGPGITSFAPQFHDLLYNNLAQYHTPASRYLHNKLMSQIYTYDTIAGPAVDLYSELPWSSFELAGIEDRRVLQTYQDALSNLKLEIYLPTISTNYLVYGRVCLHLLFDTTQGVWSNMILHNDDDLRITPVPFLNEDPMVDFVPSKQIIEFINSKDERSDVYRQYLSEELIEQIRSGNAIPLDPANTLYLPRRRLANDFLGTSIFSRIIGLVILERALFNASTAKAQRGAGAIRLLKVGSQGIGEDAWIPSDDEVDELVRSLMIAEEDPVGSIIGVKTQDITIETVAGAGSEALWRISDEVEYIQNAKFKALGISEAMLNGDACIVGDSLLQTTKGLIEIGSLGKIKDPTLQQWEDINLVCGSRYQPTKAVKWLYNGVKPTFEVLTDRGNSVQCTANHPLLVLNEKTGETEWRRTDELQPGDLLCLSTKRVVREELLDLNLKDFEAMEKQGPHGVFKPILKPTQMTPDLAFFLGVMVSEGCIYKTQVRIGNTDEVLLARCQEIVQKVFGLEAKTYLNMDPESTVQKEGKFKSGKKYWNLVITSVALVDLLGQLGLTLKSKDHRRASYHKEVPWSVLRADVECWKAYLAGHIEGDGSWGNHLAIISYSEKAIKQLDAMLCALGYLPKVYKTRLEVNRLDSLELFKEIKNYLISKAPQDGVIKARNRFGIPMTYWNTKLTRNSYKQKRLLYDRLQNGEYVGFLDDLRETFKEDYEKLNKLIECKYFFSAVKSISPKGDQPVFDISMEPGTEPAFVGCGNFTFHNTYNNMEQALSIFLDKIRTFRDFMTRKIIIEKVLEPIAKAHGFYVKKPKGFQTASLQRRGFNTTIHDTSDADLILPTIQWSKPLEPRMDQTLIELYRTAEEAGLPISMRKIAVAVGSNIQEILAEAEEDLEIRKKLARINKERAKLKAEGEGGEDSLGEGGGDMDMGGGDMGGGSSSEPPSDSTTPEMEPVDTEAPGKSVVDDVPPPPDAGDQKTPASVRYPWTYNHPMKSASSFCGVSDTVLERVAKLPDNERKEALRLLSQKERAVAKYALSYCGSSLKMTSKEVALVAKILQRFKKKFTKENERHLFQLQRASASPVDFLASLR